MAGLHVGVLGAKRFILDGVHAKLDFTGTIVAIQGFRAKHSGTSGIYIENRANGAAAISTLERH